ncbi:hypothetical protein L1987_79552 [Smallanthus sonchifolius]|uniref:Uncharacterized protein n=1 Tax=Smallanthus sonchifolius TaxID=185202 RepID=A0ACB8ZGT7_9ASTR|nr:hypothetical protein L1987_79552 [Smallanthus sonchifolius]
MKGKSSGSGNEKPPNADSSDKPKAKAKAYNISMKEAKDHFEDLCGTCYVMVVRCNVPLCYTIVRDVKLCDV